MKFYRRVESGPRTDYTDFSGDSVWDPDSAGLRPKNFIKRTY